ncbi:3-phosphoshikimate 1-carboxyvinyltransferase [Burkholderia glumae]|uniref:3-phosphoshikimate 1-carboxyvinyltransferase n=1 Tax=Burkholderia glumae TaxID=337 RepID=UPI00131FA107|nr:5-enolpyruvylshikimate-3-phosphate synthase [Burkholderia glumae]QHE13249.1 5-enolpyruvylshikimate-3-phosphate synthase [Burkholderia glumae AU6208]
MYLRVNPASHLKPVMSVPASKPETQRAIVTASLATGRSRIHNDLRCLETDTMKAACRQLGARISEHDGFLEVDGVGGQFTHDTLVIDAKGSGLVFRTLSAITCMRRSPTILTGDHTLRRRVMKPLFDALGSLGANLQHLGDAGKAPVINWGQRISRTHAELPGDVSSQFVTALLLLAPLSDQPITLRQSEPVLSKSYIAQTVDFLRRASIDIEVDERFSHFAVRPGEYVAFDSRINADYTSLSYLLFACAVFPGEYVIRGITSDTLQGEQIFIDVVQALGVKVMHDDAAQELLVSSVHARLSGSHEVDVSDGPNIIPTLVALSLFVEGEFRVVGGSVTRLHKSSRIESMVTEAAKLGADIKLLWNRQGDIDGFVTRGRSDYEGGEILTSCGDHRNFMSLFVASLKFRRPCHIDGFQDVICSFPEFLTQFEALGASFSPVPSVVSGPAVIDE